MLSGALLIASCTATPSQLEQMTPVQQGVHIDSGGSVEQHRIYSMHARAAKYRPGDDGYEAALQAQKQDAAKLGD